MSSERKDFVKKVGSEAACALAFDETMQEAVVIAFSIVCLLATGFRD
jgi:hypothetical protein